jgi:hypothetical protein
MKRPRLRIRGSIARRAMMPPSPRLSSRMITIRYLMLTIRISDQAISERTP